MFSINIFPLLDFGLVVIKVFIMIYGLYYLLNLSLVCFGTLVYPGLWFYVFKALSVLLHGLGFSTFISFLNSKARQNQQTFL